MGYSTSYRGVLEIQPPLTWPEIQRTDAWNRHLDHLDGNTFGTRLGTLLCVDEESVDTDEGVLVRRTASAVEIVGDELRHNEIVHQLHQLAAMFGDTHRFVGFIECEHDHPDALPSRLRIVGNVAQDDRPVLLWPGSSSALANVRTTLDRGGCDLTDYEVEALAVRVLRNLEDLK